MARSVDESLTGATIAGKYKLGRVIGRGAMGVVFEAAHTELGRRVAIKVIESSLAENDEVVRRFRREVRAASAAESDSIVKVFDAGVDPALGAFMVMEYLDGENLEQRLQRRPRLDLDVTVRIAYQAARALEKAHAAGVVHRDLKPANIFLAKHPGAPDTAKILDFGISLIVTPDLSTTGAMRLTQVGMTVGSPQYASPEQAQGLPSIDHRTDIWSLGVVLYEMLAGRRAYTEKDTFEEFIAHLLTQEPPKLTDVAPWVPPALAAVVHAAIRHDVNQRLPDCGTFARLLLQAVPSAAGVGGATIPMPHQALPPSDDEDRTVVVSAPVIEDSEPSGTIVMGKPSFELPDPPSFELHDLLSPDSDNAPTRPPQPKPKSLRKPPPPPRSASKSAPPVNPPDMGGFLLPLPPPRSAQPTVPSFARSESVRRRAILRFVLFALALVILVGGGTTAVVLFTQGP